MLIKASNYLCVFELGEKSFNDEFERDCKYLKKDKSIWKESKEDEDSHRWLHLKVSTGTKM